MIEYRKVYLDDPSNFNGYDTSGYYVILHKTFDGYNKFYFINGKRHRIDGAARDMNTEKEYYLFGKFYGDESKFTDETWTIFAQRILKLKAFA